MAFFPFACSAVVAQGHKLAIGACSMSRATPAAVGAPLLSSIAALPLAVCTVQAPIVPLGMFDFLSRVFLPLNLERAQAFESRWLFLSLDGVSMVNSPCGEFACSTA